MKNCPTDDALELVLAIQHEFHDKNGEKYQSFLQILSDYKAQKIDTRVFRLKVHQLLKGHKDLILRFNTFVPTQYEIELPIEENNALVFLKRVKDVFQGENKEKYYEFLETMKDFRAQRIDIRVVVERVKELFKGQTNLILEFNAFVSSQYEIKLPLDQGDAFAFINRVRDVFQGKNKGKYDEFLEAMQDFKAQRIDTSVVVERVKELFKGHTDLILEFNTFVPCQYEIKLPLDHDDKQQQCPRLEVGREDAFAFIKRVRDVFQGEDKGKYDEFLEMMKDFRALRIDMSVVVERMKELFKGHTDLILEFNTFVPTQYEMKLPLDHDDKQQQCRRAEVEDAFAFIKRVRDVFQGKNREKYDEFLEMIKDIKAQRIDTSVVVERVKELFKGHTDLILELNAFLPKNYRIMLPLQLHTDSSAENCEIPWDLLDIISRKLDFDELFGVAGVCKNWREFHKIYWRNFMASQEPLLLKKSSRDEKSFSFICIHDQRVYHSKTIDRFWNLAYSGSSSRYLIMTTENNSFILMNPFTRKKMEINATTFKVEFSVFAYHVLLAFGKGSEEFVLVALCTSSNSLHLYQSRNSDWITYLTKGKRWKVVDFVVLHNTIYVVTDKARIGVLSLNSANIKILKLKSTPKVTSSSHLRLVSCDGKLLMIHILSRRVWNVYEIDLSIKNFVEMKTLGDIALFYASGKYFYALSNPEKWGYESNSLHAINLSSTQCRVSIGNDNELPEYISHDRLSNPPKGRPYLLDWCFKHLHNEVDYSLVE